MPFFDHTLPICRKLYRFEKSFHYRKEHSFHLKKKKENYHEFLIFDEFLKHKLFFNRI